MNPEQRIEQLCEELQVLAFNLADELGTLNLHSGREAVMDMERAVFSLVADMQKRIRNLVHNLDAAGRSGDTDDAREMYSLLDIVRKCCIEPESYRHFVSRLALLIDMLDEWGSRGPIPAID